MKRAGEGESKEDECDCKKKALKDDQKIKTVIMDVMVKKTQPLTAEKIEFVPQSNFPKRVQQDALDSKKADAY